MIAKIMEINLAEIIEPSIWQVLIPAAIVVSAIAIGGAVILIGIKLFKKFAKPE